MRYTIKTLLFLAAFLTGTYLFAQSKRSNTGTDLTGNWSLVAVKSVAADSSVTFPYGTGPVGEMILAGNGSYAVQIYQAVRANIASGNKSTATGEENAMLVKGSNAHYGSYSVDRKNRLIIFRPEHAFFPNWEGKELKQTFTLRHDTLQYYSGSSTFGAAKSVVIWKRKN